jgi:diguanylate cyclase (GGDEF)-like protein
MKNPEGKIRHALRNILKRKNDQPVSQVVNDTAAGDTELAGFEKISQVALKAESLQAAYPEILDEVSRLTGFPYIFVERYDEARQVMSFEATKGIDLGSVEGPLESPVYESLSGLACRTGRVMVETKEMSRPRYIAPALAGLSIRTVVCVPMMAAKKSLGTLSLASPRDFNPEAHLLSLAATLANSIAIFSERSRAENALRESINERKQAEETINELYESERKQRRLAQLLQEAGTVLSSTLDLDQVLDSILVQLEQVVSFDSAAVFLLEVEGALPIQATASAGVHPSEDGMQEHTAEETFPGERLKLVAGKGFPVSAKLIGRYFPASNALFQEMSQTGRPVVLADVEKDPRWQGWGGVTNVHGWVGVPLAAHGEIIGGLMLDSSQPGAYDGPAAALVQAFANQAAIAIENARLFSQVQQLAITDTLTSLYNRRYFFEFATKEFERARRYTRPLSVMMLDIDRFKQVNDIYGHLIGDHLLSELAARCKETLREADVMARYGGEEFVVMLPETPVNLAFLAAERLWMAIAAIQLDVEGHKVAISVSLGVAGLDPGCRNLEALIERADQALYRAKKAGRGQIVVWNDPQSIEKGTGADS